MKKASLRLVGYLLILTLAGCGGVSSGNPTIPPTDAVAAAKAALAIGYASGDSASSVTKNLSLPTTGLDGSTIAWESSDPAFVTAAGVVKQPATQDANVTLQATITVKTASDLKAFSITVKPQMSEAQAVAASKAALAVGYAAADSDSHVTQNVVLATTGIDDSTIVWATSNPLLVTTAGVVTRPLTGTASVTLTATITVGSASDTKGFPMIVMPQLTDAQAVAAAKAALTIGYASGDSAASVTQNLTLATNGIDNSGIIWTSNNEAVVGTDGTVTQPVIGDATVTLTATITVGAVSDTQSFQVTVKAQMTDAQAVATEKAALAIGYQPGDAASSVTQNLELAVTGAAGATVSWASSDPAISIAGVVTRPVTNDLPVTLTATISLHAASDTKEFIVTVKAQMTDAEAVAAAKAALTIAYAQGDSASSVTQDVSLPVTGSSACTISWSTSDQETISAGGLVQRPAIGNEQVTLTATISSHEVSDTAQFTLTVIGQMDDDAAVAGAKAALNIVYAPGDSAASVTQNVALATTGSDACTIGWSSDTPSVVSATGTVTQPQGNPVVVTLTATISSHAVSDTKSFVLTVQPVMDDMTAVEADKAELAIVYGPGDSASHVTGNIDVPTSGVNGSAITWASSNPAIVSISGGVTVPTDNDANVTMTATITKGMTSDTADFPLTVKALLLSSWIDVNAISPGNGAIEVDPGIVVKIPFQRALDASTVTTGTFQIVETSNSQNVPIFVSYDPDSQTVSLTPQSALAQNTQYSTIVVTTLKDSGDTSLPSTMGFSFTTLSYNDFLSQWKFNGGGSDASGNGNPLMNITGTFDTEIVHEGGASLYLNGAGQNGTSDINLGTQLTIAVWVNVDNPIQSSINTIMANADTQEETNGFKLGINHWNTSDESVVIEVGDGSTGGKWITQPGLIHPGSWYHLAFVIDEPNQVMKIYYNGAEAPLSFTSDEGFRLDQFHYDFTTSGSFTIGSFPDGSYGFKGHLDDMRVYNRVLSADEIAKMAQEK